MDNIKNLTIEEIKEILLKEKVIVNYSADPSGINICASYRWIFKVKDWDELKTVLLTKHPELDHFLKEFPDSKSMLYALICGMQEAPKCPHCGKPRLLSNHKIDRQILLKDPSLKYYKLCNSLECLLKEQKKRFRENGIIINNSPESEARLNLFKKALLDEKVIVVRDSTDPVNVFGLNTSMYKHLKTDSWEEIKSILLRKHPEVVGYLEKLPTTGSTLFVVNNDVAEIPLCPYCGKPRAFIEGTPEAVNTYDPHDPLTRWYSTCNSPECLVEDLQKGSVESNSNILSESEYLRRIKEILLEEKVIRFCKFKNIGNGIRIDRHFYEKVGTHSWEEIKNILLDRHPELGEYLKEFPTSIEMTFALTFNIEKTPTCPHCGNKRKFIKNDPPIHGYSPEDPDTRWFKTCGSSECRLKEQQKDTSSLFPETPYLTQVKGVLLKEGIVCQSYSNLKNYKFVGNSYVRNNVKTWPELKNIPVSKYPELEDFFYQFPTNQAAVFAISNNLEKAPICPYCGKPRKFMKNPASHTYSNPHNNYDPNNPLTRFIQTCGDRKCADKAVKDSWIKYWGVTCVSKSPLVQEKIKQTNLRVRGVESSMHDPEVIRRGFRKYLYQNLHFDSSWELYLYIYCLDHDIPIEKSPDPIDYFDESGKLHKYYPDFKIDGKLIEIKGGHLIDSEGNLIPGPWVAKLSEEDYKKEAARLRAKQKCMEENNVELLLHEDLKKYSKYVQQTYGRNYIEQFRVKSKKKEAAD